MRSALNFSQMQEALDLKGFPRGGRPGIGSREVKLLIVGYRVDEDAREKNVL